MTQSAITLITLTADIVAAHVSNHNVGVSDMAHLITKTHSALAQLNAQPIAIAPIKQIPAVAIRASVTPDYIICLEDGKRFKTLKKHLMASFGMTADDYRIKWNLPADYPMVAPNYAAKRSAIAFEIGLGVKRGQR